MKIVVEISSKIVEAELHKLKENLWEGYANGYEGDDYKVIVENIDCELEFDIKIGSKIETSREDIKRQLVEYKLDYDKRKLENEGDGIENIEENEEYDEEKHEIKPYDPELIRVDTKPFTLSYIYELIESDEEELDLSPEFQRNFVWNDITRKSRLIESLLLRIPIPVFYFAQDYEGRFKVVDGVQRLTVIKSFMNNEFKLKNLEYLKECEGRYFKKREGDNGNVDYLEGKYIRRINQTQIICNIIDPQTPEKVKFDIFKRINTGGKSLNPQEIRNCLANNKVRKFLKELAESEPFKQATGNSISSTRMADKELVMRFIGFYYYRVLKHKNITYKGNMHSFLDIMLVILNSEDNEQLNILKKVFYNSMKNAYYLFEEYAFRKCKIKHIQPGSKKQLLNKSLFITISILLARYDYNQVRANLKKGCLVSPLVEEIENNEKYFDVLTNGTSDLSRLNKSFDFAENIIGRYVGGILND
jgi:hypothetical protein